MISFATVRRAAAVLAAATLLAAPALAQPSDAVRAVLDGVDSLFDRAPLQLDFDADLSFPVGSQTVTSSLSGTQLYGGPRHMSMDMRMAMDSPQGRVEMSMKTVYDGETMWSELNMPAMGMRNVSRASIDVLEKAGDSAAGSAPGATSMDPREMLTRLADEVSLTVASREDGIVVLEGTLDTDSADALQLNATPGLDLGGATVRLSFEEANGQPRGLKLLAQGLTMLDLRYGDVQFLEKDAVPAGAFSYTPPEGVPVRDLDEMLRGAAVSE